MYNNLVYLDFYKHFIFILKNQNASYFKASMLCYSLKLIANYNKHFMVRLSYIDCDNFYPYAKYNMHSLPSAF